MITERWNTLEEVRELIIKEEDKLKIELAKVYGEPYSKDKFIIFVDKLAETKGKLIAMKQVHMILNDLILNVINDGQEELNKMEDSL